MKPSNRHTSWVGCCRGRRPTDCRSPRPTRFAVGHPLCCIHSLLLVPVHRACCAGPGHSPRAARSRQRLSRLGQASPPAVAGRPTTRVPAGQPEAHSAHVRAAAPSRRLRLFSRAAHAGCHPLEALLLPGRVLSAPSPNRLRGRFRGFSTSYPNRRDVSGSSPPPSRIFSAVFPGTSPAASHDRLFAIPESSPPPSDSFPQVSDAPRKLPESSPRGVPESSPRGSRILSAPFPNRLRSSSERLEGVASAEACSICVRRGSRERERASKIQKTG